MAEVSPILLNTLPFDATQDHYLQFSYSGSQIQGYRLTIRDNATLEEIEGSPIINTSSMKEEALIPANTLENSKDGIIKSYKFEIEILHWNEDGSEKIYSGISNAIVLKCFATPNFGFVNVQPEMIVRNSYMDVELKYSCDDESEVMNQYRVILYGDDKTTVIYDSGTLYTISGLTVRITGLTDDATYYLEASCETLNGMELITPLTQILCNYIKPDLFLAFYAENIPTEGLVRLSSNFILIEGKSDPEELVYIDDEKVNLLPDQDGEKKVWFDSGFTAKNFTCDIIAEQLVDWSKIISFNMKSAKAHLMWYKGIFEGDETEKYYAELTAYQYVGDEPLNYIQISNRIDPPTDGEQVHIWIKHVDGLFNVKIAKLTKEEVSKIIEEGEVA